MQTVKNEQAVNTPSAEKRQKPHKYWLLLLPYKALGISILAALLMLALIAIFFRYRVEPEKLPTKDVRDKVLQINSDENYFQQKSENTKYSHDDRRKR